MPTLRQEHFTDTAKQYEQRDPELYRELQEKIWPTEEEHLTRAALAVAIAPEQPLVSEAGIPTTEGRRVAETIVRPNARPVLLIRNNRATTEFIGPDSQVWAGRIQAAQSILDAVIPAVGRVEVGNNPDFTWVGTGWLVAEEIIVTNRHVAREFGRSGGDGFTFRVGTNGGPMTSRIDFLEEAQRLVSLEYAVKSILWIAPSGEPDVAFMRVARAAGDRPLASPIPLAESVAADDFVAAIGYPARDPRIPDQDLVHKIFGDVYDKKRLAPGQIIDVKPDELEHDCSTLGGNSGSVLINLQTGQATGLHFAGLFLEANFAVPAARVHDLLRRVQQGELPGATTVKTDFVLSRRHSHHAHRVAGELYVSTTNSG
jgi:Trypsin-like peptidase domain